MVPMLLWQLQLHRGMIQTRMILIKQAVQRPQVLPVLPVLLVLPVLVRVEWVKAERKANR